MDVYRDIMHCDPFQFHCPLPLFSAGALRGLDGRQALAACCHDYAQLPLQWPYQFAECGAANCSTCWKQSGEAELARHKSAGLAALGYATALAVSGPKRMESQNLGARRRLEEQEDTTRHAGLPSRQVRAEVRFGLRPHDANLCPLINDWEEYYLNDDLENTHARVYKSASAKIAVIAFRGTQLDSTKNWAIDADTNLRLMRLRPEPPEAPTGPPGWPPPPPPPPLPPLPGAAPRPTRGPETTFVHEGFYSAAQRVLPHVQKWVEGYIEGTLGMYNVPADWQLLFTGHSLGGAFATLAATTAEVEGWSKLPDAVITFGSPRLAGGNLSEWWEANGLCDKLLRVAVYNDAIHWMPSMSAPQLVGGLIDCAANVGQCLVAPQSIFLGAQDTGSLDSGDRWSHVCPQSEFLVPGALKGVNGEMQDFSPLGGVLAHFLGNGLFGYGYGVLYGGIMLHDEHCGLKPDVFPRFECSTIEDLTGVQCLGLELDKRAEGAGGCRERCCADPYCEVWQLMKDGECWRGRSRVCQREQLYASSVIFGQRVH